MNKNELAKQILINNGYNVNTDWGFSIERSFNDLVQLGCETKSNFKQRTEHVVIGICTAGTNLYTTESIQQYFNDYNKVSKCYNELKENDCLEFDVEL
jgi:hypothetical protein